MRVFYWIGGFLILFSFVAFAIQPKSTDGQRTPLVWVTDDNPLRHQTIAQFEASNPNVVVHLDPDNGGMQKVIVQSLAGVGPDLFDCYDPNQLTAFVRAGIALDITDDLKAAGINASTDIFAASRDDAVINGRAYGFPENAASDALFFNKDIFEKQGVPYPVGGMTWEQFLPLAEKMTLRDSNGHVTQYGFASEDIFWVPLIKQWGGALFSSDGKRCTLDSPEAIAAVQFMHDLVYKYHVSPSPTERDAMASAGGWGQSSMKSLVAGRAAMVLGSRWWLVNLRTHPELRLGVVEMPHGPINQTFGYGRAIVINRMSHHKAEAFQFVKYIAGEPYNMLVNQAADGIGPVMKYATAANLFNPAFPNEDFHPVFLASLKIATPNRSSPYVDYAAAQAAIDVQMDLVRHDAKPVPEAMRAAAAAVNAMIDTDLGATAQ